MEVPYFLLNKEAIPALVFHLGNYYKIDLHISKRNGIHIARAAKSHQ